MLQKQIIAKLFRLCLKLTQRCRFELDSSNRRQCSANVFCVSLNFVKHKVGFTAWKLRLSKLHFSAGRVLESDSSLIIMMYDSIQTRLWVIGTDRLLADIRSNSQVGLVFFTPPKTNKQTKKHILVLTLCSRSLSHTMKLTARHRQLIQREAISPAGGVWRRDRWLAVLNCNTSVQHLVIETLTLNSVKLLLMLLHSNALLVRRFFVSPWFCETIKNELTVWYHHYRRIRLCLCSLLCFAGWPLFVPLSLSSLHITVNTRLDWKPWLAQFWGERKWWNTLFFLRLSKKHYLISKSELWSNVSNNPLWRL